METTTVSCHLYEILRVESHSWRQGYNRGCQGLREGGWGVDVLLWSFSFIRWKDLWRRMGGDGCTASWVPLILYIEKWWRWPILLCICYHNKKKKNGKKPFNDPLLLKQWNTHPFAYRGAPRSLSSFSPSFHPPGSRLESRLCVLPRPCLVRSQSEALPTLFPLLILANFSICSFINIRSSEVKL